MAYIRRFLRRHFHAVRIAKEDFPRAETPSPLIVYLNHPSWWDPLLGLYLGDQFFGDRALYGPIDAAQLERYRIFSRLGFYGVNKQTAQGARSFLRTSAAILEQANSMIWMTPQGKFVDSRQTNGTLERGLAMLVKRHPQAHVMPLALEYVFWNDRLPEVLVRFGKATPCHEITDQGQTLDKINDRLAQDLFTTQRKLAEDSMQRDPARFHTCARGKSGVGGIYDTFRRVRAWCRGQPFTPEHGGTDA